MIFVRIIFMNFKRTISFILMFIYGMSSCLGVGIVRCGCTESQRIVFMSIHPSCLCSYSADDCCAHNYQHHDDDEETGCQDEECCSFFYKFVDTDHLNVIQYIDQPAKETFLLFFPILSVNGWMDSIKECTDTIKNNSPPLCLLKIPLIYMHGQLRL